MFHCPQLSNQVIDKIEVQFSTTNKNVEFTPKALCWKPFELPKGLKVDFVQGLKTILGHGDATMREGVAVHIYTANASMRNRAFSSCDGDMLVMPQSGRLNIQTEFGK